MFAVLAGTGVTSEKWDVAGGSEGTRAAARREFGVLDFKTGRAI